MAVATSTIIAGIGLAIAGFGAAKTYQGQAQATKASKTQERIRKQQMDLDIQRKRREAIRKMLAARAMGVSNATNQGASLTDSAVVGGLNQTTQSANTSSMELNQNAQLGDNMFSANAMEANGRGMASFGNAVQSWGSGIIQNSTTISRVGANFNLWKNAY